MVKSFDLKETLSSVTFLEGRTIDSDTRGTFSRVTTYRDGGIFVGGFSGISQWERHPNGDELVQVLKGAVTLTLKVKKIKKLIELGSGMLAIVPKNTWHQFYSPTGVTLMTITPEPTEHYNVSCKKAV